MTAERSRRASKRPSTSPANGGPFPTKPFFVEERFRRLRVR